MRSVAACDLLSRFLVECNASVPFLSPCLFREERSMQDYYDYIVSIQFINVRARTYARRRQPDYTLKLLLFSSTIACDAIFSLVTRDDCFFDQVMLQLISCRICK